MRVLVLHNRYATRGGEDAVVDEECALLERNGHAVERLFADNAEVRAHGLAGVNVAVNTLWSRAAAERVRSAIARFRPEVMHVHNTLPQLSPSVYAAARSAGVPVVQTLHNYRLLCPSGLLHRAGQPCHTCVDRLWPWPGIQHACYRDSRTQTSLVAALHAARRLPRGWTDSVAVFVALTTFAQEQFIAGGLPSDRLVVKPNFLSHDPGQRTGAGEYCLYVGRLSREKGMRTLLRSWAHADAPPLRVAGTGPLQREVQAAAGRHPAITYLGELSREQVFEQLRGARLLVFPSECYENFPMAIVEAFACGVPVLASRVGGLPEIVEDGRHGWLAPSGDAEALAAAVQRAWHDVAGTTHAGEVARQTFEERYSAEQQLGLLLAIYERARSAGSAVSRNAAS